MGQSRVTPIGRCSFPSLDKPSKFGKYTLTILLPKEDPKVKEFVQWLGATVKAEALAIAGDAGYASAMSYFEAFKNGDDAKAFKTYRNEYPGHWVLSLGRKAEYGAPCVVGRQKQPIPPLEVYAGCNVLAYIDVFGYNFSGKKSVTIGFQHVMKTGENTRFSSTGVAVDSAFSDLDLPDELPDEIAGGSPFGAGVGVSTTTAVPAQQPVRPTLAPAQQPRPVTAAVKDPFAGV